MAEVKGILNATALPEALVLPKDTTLLVNDTNMKQAGLKFTRLKTLEDALNITTGSSKSFNNFSMTRVEGTRRVTSDKTWEDSGLETQIYNSIQNFDLVKINANITFGTNGENGQIWFRFCMPNASGVMEVLPAFEKFAGNKNGIHFSHELHNTPQSEEYNTFNITTIEKYNLVKNKLIKLQFWFNTTNNSDFVLNQYVVLITDTPKYPYAISTMSVEYFHSITV